MRKIRRNRRVTTGTLKARDGRFTDTIQYLTRIVDGKQTGLYVLVIEKDGDSSVNRWL